MSVGIEYISAVTQTVYNSGRIAQMKSKMGLYCFPTAEFYIKIVQIPYIQ